MANKKRAPSKGGQQSAVDTAYFNTDSAPALPPFKGRESSSLEAGDRRRANGRRDCREREQIQ